MGSLIAEMGYPPSHSLENVLKSNTYSLSLDNETTCDLPIVDTEYGAFTAGHCIRDLKRKGYKKVYGINDFGHKNEFRLIGYKEVYRGLDYAFLRDKDNRGIRIGNSKLLKKGDVLYMYSPKYGLSQGTVKIIPDKRYEDFRIYTDLGKCGESGSGVYNSKGELIGIFVARTGAPGNDSPGVVLKIHSIIEDLG